MGRSSATKLPEKIAEFDAYILTLKDNVAAKVNKHIDSLNTEINKLEQKIVDSKDKLAAAKDKANQALSKVSDRPTQAALRQLTKASERYDAIEADAKKCRQLIKIKKDELKNSKRYLKKLTALDKTLTGFSREWNQAEAANFVAIPSQDELAPKRRGRPPKAEADSTEQPKRRGRPPKAKTAKAAPKRRGRPPKAASATPSAPKRRGRPPKVKPEAEAAPAVESINGQQPAVSAPTAEASAD